MQIKLDIKIFIFAIFFFLLGDFLIYAKIIEFAFLHEMGHMFTRTYLRLKTKEITNYAFSDLQFPLKKNQKKIWK